MSAKLQIKLVKGLIGEREKVKRTVKSLGLRKLQQTVVHEVNGPLLGKLDSVKHLIEITEV
jgi:large subunit ribosomal protein L30